MKFKEYEKNCNEVKALIEQINSFFKSENGNDINVSSYYTNDFISILTFKKTIELLN